MNARRTIVWITSLIFGLTCSIAVLLVFGTSLESFSVGNALLVFISTASLAFIWLDFIFKTAFLRS